jgi:DNA-binding transcriptional regulator YdaS (Cro superfamily)
MYEFREALKDAIRIKGTQAALAEAIGKEQGHIWFWLNKAKKLPAEIAIAIEQATNGKVPRSRLRSDIFPEKKR